MASKANRTGRGDGWRIARWTIPALLLTIPLIAKAPWTLSDFLVMGVLLFGSVGIYELAARASGSLTYRAGIGVAVATSFLLIWINLAVGIIGSEDNPLNLLYAGVLGVALLGSVVTRFGPGGMARAFAVTAVAQALVGAVAVMSGANEPPGALGLAILNGGFVALWLAAAALFRRTAR